MGTPAYMPPEQALGRETDAAATSTRWASCLYKLTVGPVAIPDAGPLSEGHPLPHQGTASLPPSQLGRPPRTVTACLRRDLGPAAPIASRYLRYLPHL